MRLMKKRGILFVNKYLCVNVQYGNYKELFGNTWVREWTFYKGRQCGLWVDVDEAEAQHNMVFHKMRGDLSRKNGYYPWYFGSGRVGLHRRIKYVAHPKD